MSADVAVQKAIRNRLVAKQFVTDLVPAANILDRHARPAPSPSIIIGEGQSVEGDRIDRRDQRVILDLHVWKQETSTAGVKAIAGAVRAALHAERLPPSVEHQFADCRVSSMRYLRDPGGEYSHAVVTVETLVVETA